MARRRSHYNSNFKRGKITGRRTIKTIKELRAMGEEVLKAAKKALQDGAEMVVADAKSRVPVRTGKLRDSIQAVPNKDGTVYSISANAFRTVQTGERAGQRFYYGQAVEFDPKIDKPFLYPAMDANREKIYDLIQSEINNAIKGA